MWRMGRERLGICFPKISWHHFRTTPYCKHNLTCIGSHREFDLSAAFPVMSAGSTGASLSELGACSVDGVKSPTTSLDLCITPRHRLPGLAASSSPPPPVLLHALGVKVERFWQAAERSLLSSVMGRCLCRRLLVLSRYGGCSERWRNGGRRMVEATMLGHV